MNLSLACPSCARSIGDFKGNPTQVFCSACNHRYGVVYGKLSRRSSIHETLLFLTAKLPRLDKRHYTLQITTPDRCLKLLQFSLSGREDEVPAHRGDVVSVLYTMQGYVMKKLVAITNHTTGKHYVLPSPIPSPTYLTTNLSVITIGLLTCAFVSGGGVFTTLICSGLGMLAYLKLANIAHLFSPPLETIGREGNRLIADQRLLAQKLKIERRIEELSHEGKTNQVLIRQLEDLKAKMSHLDAQLYAARIYRATSAVKILKQQIANNQRLIREYRRTQRMIEIEVETSWIADQLPDTDRFTRTIVQKLEELKTIEEQNQFLKLQLNAYEEVSAEGMQIYRL